MEALTTTSLPSTRSLLNRGAGGGAAAGESWSRRTRSCRIRSRSAGGGRCRGETSSLPGSTLGLPGCRPRAIGGHPSVKCSFLSPLPISMSWGSIATDFEAAADCSWTFSACSGYGRRKSSRMLVPSSSFPSPMPAGDGSEEENDAVDNGHELERAFGMDGSIPGSSEEFLRRVSSRAYSMRSHFMQTIGSSSYEVLERNPWREDSKLVFVLTHGNNQLCTMKTRQSRSEVERELGLLFSRRTKWDDKVDNMAKHSRSGNKFNMLVEDIREGVLVFEDESEASKYCELLQGGGQGCEGIAELEVSSVFDICQTMRALAVLFRRGRTPPLPKSLEQNLRARKRSLEDQDIL